MDLYQVMRTTFAGRRFLDEPVPDADLHRILDNARFAPSGGNRQGWRVIVIRDPATRERFVEWVRPVMRRYLAQMVAGESPFNSIVPSKVDDEAVANAPAPDSMIEGIMSAPVLLLVCVDLAVLASFDADLDRVGLISGASVYPFVWNILLAARNEGYAGTVTTYLAPSEPEVQALLGIPPHVALAALVPLGRPEKQLTKLKRNSVEEITAHERWEGAPLTAD